MPTSSLMSDQNLGIAFSFYHHEGAVLQTWYGVIQDILRVPVQFSPPQASQSKPVVADQLQDAVLSTSM